MVYRHVGHMHVRLIKQQSKSYLIAGNFERENESPHVEFFPMSGRSLPAKESWTWGLDIFILSVALERLFHIGLYVYIARIPTILTLKHSRVR